MRAALLPTPGDPFMLAYWLRNYETWRKYVDELVVYQNGPLAQEDVDYDRRIVERAGGVFVSDPYRAGHDGAILRLLEETTANHVVLCEDDAYVRHPEVVGQSFSDIENNRTDIVGSPRHEDYASSPLYDFGPYVPGALGELRHGLWPAFLFIRRRALLDTDHRFGDRAWHVGDTITGWGPVTPETCAFVGVAPDFVHLDTLFGTTFQLRAAGLRTRLVHHVRLYDAPAVESWLAEDPPWFHVTGLSTLDYVLNDRDDVTELPLWPRRLAWWFRTTRAEGSFDPIAGERMRALMAFEKRWDIDNQAVLEWERRFDPWVNW